LPIDISADCIHVLAIAGHTHGGQVNLPIIGRRVNATSLSAEHSYGFSKLADIDVFVSAGVGTSILPVRFRASPEIVILTVKSSA
jgi:predicted MPP superfamily phosphohydrolase